MTDITEKNKIKISTDENPNAITNIIKPPTATASTAPSPLQGQVETTETLTVPGPVLEEAAEVTVKKAEQSPISTNSNLLVPEPDSKKKILSDSDDTQSHLSSHPDNQYLNYCKISLYVLSLYSNFKYDSYTASNSTCFTSSIFNLNESSLLDF